MDTQTNATFSTQLLLATQGVDIVVLEAAEWRRIADEITNLRIAAAAWRAIPTELQEQLIAGLHFEGEMHEGESKAWGACHPDDYQQATSEQYAALGRTATAAADFLEVMKQISQNQAERPEDTTGCSPVQPPAAGQKCMPGLRGV